MQQYPGIFSEPVFTEIIKQDVSDDVKQWLLEKARLIQEEKNAAHLNLAFAAVPRKTRRQIFELTQDEQDQIKEVHPDFSINGWTIDKLCRIWLLMQVNPSDKDQYISKLENLFKAAEMNELAALYAALTVFAYPEYWQTQCAEGIRSNIGLVLEAIMYNNPYPAKHLSEQAWNQLVLKAFFTDKDVTRITGLDERANKELAAILIDYASERRTAHRAINPQLWRLVSAFIDDTNCNHIEKAFNSSDVSEKNAAALACYFSNYQPARRLIEAEPSLQLAISENKLNWNNL